MSRLKFRPPEQDFLDVEGNIKVAGASGFVGRRRALQRCLKALADPGDYYGVFLHGMGGLGKSTLAARLCRRHEARNPGFERVVLVGPVDEPRLRQKLSDKYGNIAEIISVLNQPAIGFKHQLADFFRIAADNGRPLLLVLDDFEQNIPPASVADGLLRLGTEAYRALAALCFALEESNTASRLIVTCRYHSKQALPANRLFVEGLAAMPAIDIGKKTRALLAGVPKEQRDQEREKKIVDVADGNPRLLEWLMALRKDLVGDAWLAELQSVEGKFRENILAEKLLATLSEAERKSLARLSLFELAVPKAVVEALSSRSGTENAVNLGLLEKTISPGEDLYRVTTILHHLLKPVLAESEWLDARRQATRKLHEVWWEIPKSTREDRVLEVIRLAVLAGEQEIAVALADWIATQWINRSRFLEALELCRFVMSAMEDHRILGTLARAEEVLGQADSARDHYERALAICPESDEREKSSTLHNLADLVRQQGDIARALSLRQGSLEIFEHIGDVQGKAATLTNMAHAIAQQGDTARALDLWQESLEIKERIGDVKGRGDTLHEMALVIAQQGDFARALDLSQQALELSERIGDAEGKAASLNQMAVVIAQQGDIARALDLWEQSLEIKERIGDVQGKAATLANMAWVANKSGDPARGDQLNTHTQAAQALGSVRAYLDLITVLRNLGATAQKERSIYAAQAAWLVIRVQVPVPASIRTLETLLSPLSRRGLASGGIRRTDRDLGQRGTVKLKLAERGTRLPNKLWIREVRKLTESGEQVSLISTHLGLDARALAASLFARWAQENFFRYMRQNYAIDTLVERGDEAISDTEVAVNPAWRTLDRDVRKQNAALTKERARFAGVGLTEPLSDAEVIHYQLGQAQQQAKVEGLQRQLDQLKQKRKATPHHIPVKDLPEKDRFTRLLSERKHFIDTIKMICYRAENSMMSIIREKMGRADDAHSFLRQIYNLDVDLVSDLQANTLTIRLHHLAQAAHDDVARHLCDQLNETETLFPDTQLKLLFKVGSA